VQPLRNFPAYYGTRRYITVFTRALHWSLTWARSIQSTPSNSVSLTTYFNNWLPHQYPICIPGRPHSYYMPCPSHPPWLDHSNYVWRGVQVMKLLIMKFSPIARCSVNANSVQLVLGLNNSFDNSLADLHRKSGFKVPVSKIEVWRSLCLRKGISTRERRVKNACLTTGAIPGMCCDLGGMCFIIFWRMDLSFGSDHEREELARRAWVCIAASVESFAAGPQTMSLYVSAIFCFEYKPCFPWRVGFSWPWSTITICYYHCYMLKLVFCIYF
jgi:hypothetical protein